MAERSRTSTARLFFPRVAAYNERQSGDRSRRRLRNSRAVGQAMRSVPPYALGYNPYVPRVVGNYTPSGPGVGGYPGLPFAGTMTTNPYAAYTGSPGYDASMSANPYSNPYSSYYGDPY